MPVVGKTSKRYEYRCDDGNNALKPQEILAMGLMSVSQHNDNGEVQEQEYLKRLGAIAECWVCSINSTNHSAIISAASKITQDSATIQRWKNGEILRGDFTKYKAELSRFLTLQKNNGAEPLSTNNNYSLEIIPLEISEEMNNKIQKQFEYWTMDPEEEYSGSLPPMFDISEQGKYYVQYKTLTMSEEGIKKLISEEFIPIVGMRMYYHTYTAPTWVCNETYVSKVPTTDTDKATYRQKLLDKYGDTLISKYNIDTRDTVSTEDLDKAIWDHLPCTAYSQIPSTPIGIASGDNNPFFKNNTYWTKKKLKEFGFLTESPGLTW